MRCPIPSGTREMNGWFEMGAMSETWTLGNLVAGLDTYIPYSQAIHLFRLPDLPFNVLIPRFILIPPPGGGLVFLFFLCFYVEGFVVLFWFCFGLKISALW